MRGGPRERGPICPGSGADASVQDLGVAVTKNGSSVQAYQATGSSVILRFPKGLCPTCHRMVATDTGGRTRPHTDKRKDRP